MTALSFTIDHKGWKEWNEIQTYTIAFFLANASIYSFFFTDTFISNNALEPLYSAYITGITGLILSIALVCLEVKEYPHTLWQASTQLVVGFLLVWQYVFVVPCTFLWISSACFYIELME